MKKKVSTELCYFLGILFLATGTAFITISDFGVSMIVAPAYLTHLKVSEYFSFFSFGMAEYVLQGFLIVVMCFVLKKFRFSYVFSFFTAVIYGFTLDFFLFLLEKALDFSFYMRILWLVVGIILATLGISLFFHTYISPEAYELFVKKVSVKFNFDLYKFKICYDIASLVVSIFLSFVLFGKLTAIGIGTVVTAFVNGKLISLWSGALEKRIDFYDKFTFRKHFDEE